MKGTLLINDNTSQQPCTSQRLTNDSQKREDSLNADQPARHNSPSKRPAKMGRSSLKGPKVDDSLSRTTPNSRRVHFEAKEEETINESNVWNEADIRRLRE